MRTGKVAIQKDILIFVAADDVKTFKCCHIGYLTGFLLVMPNFATAIQGVITINDKDGYLLYTSGNIAENGTTLTNPTNNIPVGIDDVITLTLNDVAGLGGGTVVSKLYVEVK